MSKLADKVKDLGTAKSQDAILAHLKNLLVETDMPEKIKDIQNLPIHHFRDLTTQESELISEIFKIKTIKDLAKISYEEVLQNMTFLRKEKIAKKKLELLISAARYIVEAAEYKPSEEKKVVFAGLANAGKTALIRVMKHEAAGILGHLASLKPTLGVLRDEVIIKGQKFSVIELGGQETYRKAYIENPGRFFLGTDIIVYLIDMQDEKNYAEALDYLSNILRVVSYLQESPEFIILLHKSDPDLLDTPSFLDNIEYIKQQVNQIFQSYEFRFDIQVSSIIHSLSMSPTFPKMLRGMFDKGVLEDKRKIEAISDLITSVVDMLLTLEKSTNDRLTAIEQNLNLAQQQLLPPKEPSVHPVTLIEHSPNLTPRDALMGELKSFFAKKYLNE